MSTLTRTGTHKHGGSIYSTNGTAVGVVAKTRRPEQPYLCNVWATLEVTFHATRKAAMTHLATAAR